MLVGAMNNPGRDLFAEMRWMSDLKLDFIDLTLEPPAAAPCLPCTDSRGNSGGRYGDIVARESGCEAQ